MKDTGTPTIFRIAAFADGTDGGNPAGVVRHTRAITFQLAVTCTIVRATLAAIRRLRAPPLCA